MTLLQAWLDITSSWRDVFAQERTAVRAVRQALGSLVCLGRRTVTRILWASGREQHPWQAEYHLFARAKWAPQDLFNPIVQGALPLCRGGLVGVALDDTKLHKSGRCILQAFYQRDPMSPPFHANLILGLRFLPCRRPCWCRFTALAHTVAAPCLSVSRNLRPSSARVSGRAKRRCKNTGAAAKRTTCPPTASG